MDTIFAFKTNLKCGGCKAKLSPYLDEAKGIRSWELDLEHSNKTLTIHSKGIKAEDVINLVNQAGYTADPI